MRTIAGRPSGRPWARQGAPGTSSARRPHGPTTGLIAAAILLLGMLAALALGISASQTRARSGVEERFADAAKTRARLTYSLFAASSAESQATDARLYGGPHVSTAALTAAAVGGKAPDELVIGSHGEVLAASAGTPPALAGSIVARSAYIRRVLAGQPFALSNVTDLGRGRIAVQFAQGFQTPHGRRVLVSGFSPRLLAGFIGGYLADSTDGRGAHAYLLDERGVVLAGASSLPPTLTRSLEGGLLSAVARRNSGSFGSGRYFVASAVPGSSWRVVLAEASGTLFASVSGTSEWLPWILFAAFAMVAILALGLVARVLRNAERKRESDARERTLSDERLQTAAIVESSDDAIIGKTLDGTITTWNRGAESLYGYRAEEIVGKSIDVLVPPDRRDELPEIMARIKRDEVECLETVRVDAEGRRIDVSLTVSPVYDSDHELTGAATIARDISDRKHFEEELVLARDKALAASREKSEFVANMSHEIRTPLNGVIGMADLLRETALDPVQREYTEALAASGDALLSIISDILDFSKIEAGRLELDPTDFDVRNAVEEACLMLAEQAHAKGLEISHWVDAEVPLAVTGDRARLRQVLLNLLSNAVKFTPAGEVVLRVCRDQGDQLRFAISDTGVGLDGCQAVNLFEAFTQGDASTTRQYGGTGLGLTISRQLVERMGGAIHAEPGEDGGSVFWFTAELPAASTTAEPDGPRPELRGLRALIVDNNATNRAILEHYLHAWGLTCQSVEDSAAAIASLERATQDGQPFQVAVLDFKMPDMNGLQLASAIGRRPALRDLGMVMLSSAQVDPRAVADSNVSALLSKPARQADLYRAIGDAVAGMPSGGERQPLAGRQGAASTEAEPEGPLVLVAEDNEVNRAVAKALLAKRGLRSEAARNGLEAVQMAVSHDYAAILMDCQMPELDGYEATRRIRAAENDQHVPIIAMTAHSMQGDRERCLAAGMDDYLSKPIRNDQLDEAVQRWLSDRLQTRRRGPTGPRGGASAEDARATPVLDANAGAALDANAAAALDAGVVGGTGNGDAGATGEEAAAGARDGEAAGAGGRGGDVLDEATVHQLRETLTDEMRARLIETFEESLSEYVADISDAARRGDQPELRRAAHLLKGSSATLGAAHLRAACQRIERSGREGDAPVGEQQLEELEITAAEARRALRERLA